MSCSGSSTLFHVCRHVGDVDGVIVLEGGGGVPAP